MQNHWIWKDSEALKFWMHLLFNANHKTCTTNLNNKLVSIQRGSLVGGRMAFSRQTGISERKIRRFLSMLEDDSMLSIIKTAKYSIISITNYDDYQTKVQHKSSISPASDPHLNNGNNDNKKEEYPLPCFVDRELWDDYMEVRKKNKIASTDTAKKLLVNKLVKMHEVNPDYPRLSLENSIVGSWRSVFTPDDKNKISSGYTSNHPSRKASDIQL